jgi:hypothetical protein
MRRKILHDEYGVTTGYTIRMLSNMGLSERRLGTKIVATSCDCRFMVCRATPQSGFPIEALRWAHEEATW